MRHGGLSWITRTVLLASLATPFPGLAQVQSQLPAKKHKHYTLVDIGTFGGPHSQVNFNSRVINSRGAVAAGASTSVPDPICGFDYPFCFYFHALKWQDGVETDLGTLPGGNNSFAVAINSRGCLAGASDTGVIDPVFGPEGDATLWKDGHIIDLGTLGGIFSLALDINDRGQVVGGAWNTIPDPFGDPGATELRAFLWQGGQMQDLGTLGDGPDAFAQFVNERGQVAGISYTSSVPNPETGVPTIDPFLWDNGLMIDLGTFGGVFSVVAGLNNRGQVTGSSNVTRDGSIDHAFLWDRGSLQDLGTLGGDFSFATWIDDSGQAVGGATTPDNLTLRATRWKNGNVTNLGSLYGDICSIAFGSNSAGQIVGNSIPCDVDGASSRPFLWENGGPMVDMNSLIPPGSGLILREGVFINEAGEIAGVADLDNGEQHAFLLIPKDGDNVEAASATATRSVALPALQSPRPATHARLTPELLTALRARIASRNWGLGTKAPKQAN
jgi:probable HAF family extracellular repeat protein